MNDRAEYLLQILEKIGSPLMASILAAPGRAGQSDQLQQDALRMAELLGKTTLTSIEMSQSMDFGVAGDRGDSLRVALAAVAGSLIGAFFKQHGKAPADSDIKKIIAALQAVLTYSDNFTPSAETAMRLQNLDANGMVTDPYQASLQYVHAFIPVVSAINEFPFGQPEQKLIMVVSSRLVQKANDMRGAIFGELPEPDKKRVELGILRTLAAIYGATHSAETARLMSMSDEQRAGTGLTLESVWKNFETQSGMLEILAQGMAPSSGDMTDSGSTKTPTQFPQPIKSEPVAQPPQQSPPDNPMSMFSKKPAESDTSEPLLPSTTPAAPALQKSEENQHSRDGSPMSFFKAPPKKDGE